MDANFRPARSFSAQLREGLNPIELRALEALPVQRRRLARGDPLYRRGDAVTAIHEVRAGSCMTVATQANGRRQVTGYHLPGEPVGLHGLATDRHDDEAVAAQSSELLALPYAALAELTRDHAGIQRNLLRLLSQELVTRMDGALVLGRTHGLQRLACFLIDLSRRQAERGGSATDLMLHLTRAEIGSLIGLELATVSRLLGKLEEQGLVRRNGRVLELTDPAALHAIAGTCAQRGAARAPACRDTPDATMA